MRYLALACDYDGTLATHGRVDDASLLALERLLASGRKLILVTGRELPDLNTVFGRLDLFEWVVAENGALLYCPATHEEKLLCPAPPAHFIRALQEQGVVPVSAGRGIVATWRPHETVVLEVIQQLGLELQVIFNKGAVMVLPAGVNKATGLAAALHESGLSAHNVVAVGDAENDHAFLRLCECAVAVANALPAIKERADFTTQGDHGRGVTELIEELVGSDLRKREERLTRHHLLLGVGENGEEISFAPYGESLLIAGTSGSGKSTIATSILERMAERKYQFCIIDPEGDYEGMESAVGLGNSQRGPSIEEVLQLLRSPDDNLVVNLVGVPLADRPSFFLALLPRLQEMRARFGRPHWLIIDEAHHLLPTSWEPANLALPNGLDRTILITVHPNQVAKPALAAVSRVLAVGQSPESTLLQFCEGLGTDGPCAEKVELQPGEVLFWTARSGGRAVRLRIPPSRTEHRRHSRKYAEGELSPERSFYFRGPDGKLNLRAHNLIFFLQLADGVDEATWMHHLRRGDYSRWFLEQIKDETLAAEAARIEGLHEIGAAESAALIRAAIEQKYTLPASSHPAVVS